MTSSSASPAAPSRWKPLAVLAAIFLFGGVTGVAIGRITVLRDLESTFRGPPTEARAHFRLESMRRHLDLTDAQVRELETIFTEAETERDKLLDACRPGLDALRDSTDTRVKGVLTPEQRARYEDFASMGKRRPGPPRGPGLRGHGPGGRGD